MLALRKMKGAVAQFLTKKSKLWTDIRAQTKKRTQFTLNRERRTLNRNSSK